MIKESSLFNKGENIVLFPSLRAQKRGEKGEAKMENSPLEDDPLESLLNEFQSPSSDESGEGEVGNILSSSEQFLEEEFALKFREARQGEEKFEVLFQINSRIKYYLNEIESFLSQQK